MKRTFETITNCCGDIVSVLLQIRPLAAVAERGRKRWAIIAKHVRDFQWELFSCKVLQEEEAPPGVDIDPDEHAPIRLVDYKFEIKFRRFTHVDSDRLKNIIDEVRFTDARKEAEWAKQQAIADLAAEEKRQVGQGETDLSEEEVEEVIASVEPLPMIAFMEISDCIGRALRVNYEEISKVFKFYAAGGEGGRSDGLSAAEWWGVCNDMKVLASKDARTKVDKGEIEEIFQATDTPEQITMRERAAERKARADQASDEAMIGMGLDTDDMEHDSSDNEQPTGDIEGKEEEEEYSWELGDGERELQPEQWVEALLRLACRKFGGTGGTENPDLFVPLDERLQRLIDEYLSPNAMKSNTDTFRGEMSLDEVQAVFKKYKPQLMAVFKHYAREHPCIPGQPLREPSMNGKTYLTMLKDSRVVTRKGDLRDDFPEIKARKVFNDSQMEEEGSNSVDTGGGDEEMIYMEYIECWCAISCYKFPNPYIPLQTKLEETLTKIVFPNQANLALKGMGRKKKK